MKAFRFESYCQELTVDKKSEKFRVKVLTTPFSFKFMYFYKMIRAWGLSVGPDKKTTFSL